MRVPIAVALALGCCSGFCGGPAAAQVFQNPFGFGQERQPPARPRPPGPPRAKAAPQPEAPPVEVTTPYDADIVRLGNDLNGTYLAYGGAQGEVAKERQAAQDVNAASMGAGAPVERSVAKAQSAYTNSGWDLVDAVQHKSVDVKKMKDDELPATMQKMTPADREKYVQKVGADRASIQVKINDLNEKRRVFLSNQAKIDAPANTLDAAMLTSVKAEAAKKGFSIE